MQLALEMMWCFAGSYFSWFTPMTTVMSSFFAGAEMMTFFAPGVDVALGLLGVGEQAGAFDHDTRRRAPSTERRRAFLHGEALDLVPVDDQHVVFGHVGSRFLAAHFAVEPALRGVVFEQVSEVVRGNEVVDRDDVDFFAEQARRRARENETPDAAEPLMPILVIGMN